MINVTFNNKTQLLFIFVIYPAARSRLLRWTRRCVIAGCEGGSFSSLRAFLGVVRRNCTLPAVVTLLFPAILLITTLLFSRSLPLDGGTDIRIAQRAPSNDITEGFYQFLKDESKNQHPLCHVNCTTGTPCEYVDEVDLRLVVITYNRPYSLRRTLESIKTLKMFGDSLSVEIWIDRSKDGKIDMMTLNAALAFKNDVALSAGDPFLLSRENTRVCVHLQSSNANIAGQWVHTWRPKKNTAEIGLILEDDIDLSPYAYKWLKAVTAKYGRVPDVAGYTLQMENVNNFTDPEIPPLRVSKEHSVFMYPTIGTWGYAPRPEAWRAFQDWHLAYYPDKLVPLVPGVPVLVPNIWYMLFLEQGTTSSFWSMWHIYYTNRNKQYTIYCNLLHNLNRSDLILSSNRREPGLHFSGRAIDNTANLMREWQDAFVAFPKRIIRFNYNGMPVQYKNEYGGRYT